MDHRNRALFASAAALGLFALVQIGAVSLVGPFEDAGFRAVEDPQDPTNSLAYFLALLAATGVMLLIIRYDVDWLLRAVLVLASVLLSWYVFAMPAGALAPSLGVPAIWLSGGAAVVLGLALYVYPEWYVIDAAGLVMGIGAAAIFGISFGVLPAILLLSALAIYDAVAVYRTRHMLTLASGVMDLRVPVVLVFPLRLDYSFLSETADVSEEDAGEGERDAFFVGLGDAVMPTIVVASAAAFVEAPAVIEGTAFTVPVLGGMVGTLLGMGALLVLVFRGRAHAGLPLLNGGAILGYLLGALAVGIPLTEALGLAPYL